MSLLTSLPPFFHSVSQSAAHVPFHVSIGDFQSSMGNHGYGCKIGTKCQYSSFFSLFSDGVYSISRASLRFFPHMGLIVVFR